MTDALRIDPRWKRFRYLLSTGEIVDVLSPYNSDSTDREAVLIEAGRRYGVDKERKIAGYAVLAAEEEEHKHDGGDQ